MERTSLGFLLMLVSTLSFGAPLGPIVAAAEDAHQNSDAPATPAGAAEKEPTKPKPKPKPKKIDKDKNCSWGEDANLDIDGKPLVLTQDLIAKVMKGAESEQDGYKLFAKPDGFALSIKSPEGAWFVTSMSRLGDPNEGCVFYLLGEAKPLDAEPPLF